MTDTDANATSTAPGRFPGILEKENDMTPTIPPLADHPRVAALDREISEAVARQAADGARLLALGARNGTSAPVREDPRAVLRREAPPDARLEAAELQRDTWRIGRAIEMLHTERTALADALARDVRGPVAAAHAALAGQILAAWRDLAHLHEQERKLLALLPNAGYPSGGLQAVRPYRVDLDDLASTVEVVERAARDAERFAAACAPSAPQPREAS